MPRALAALLLLAACSKAPDAVPAASPAPAPAPVASTASSSPAPAPAAREEISIEAVVAANPLVVRGHARTFENALSLRLRDAEGELLDEIHTTSHGEMGQHNPYEAQFWLTAVPRSPLTVEAFEYSARDGSIRSLTRRRVDYDAPAITAILSFPAGDCTRFADVERVLPKSSAMARLLVEALVAGPTPAERKRGASSPFPKGSAVRAVTLKDGQLTVDFDERLQNVGGACAATAIRESVTRTLRQLPTVRGVVITAGGSRELALQP